MCPVSHSQVGASLDHSHSLPAPAPHLLSHQTLCDLVAPDLVLPDLALCFLKQLVLQSQVVPDLTPHSHSNVVLPDQVSSQVRLAGLPDQAPGPGPKRCQLVVATEGVGRYWTGCRCHHLLKSPRFPRAWQGVTRGSLSGRHTRSPATRGGTSRASFLTCALVR